jgi:formate hydrogenlyase subunit 3/multisubunit Na+/H+ antiporter MnhD subunit
VSGSAILVIMSLVAPLALAALLAVPAARPWIRPVAWTAAVPALVLAIAGELGTLVDLPWFLTGVGFGLDELGRIFLLFTSLLWMTAGLYARVYMKDDPRAVRFHAFFLLTLAGNLGLILAQEMVGFYLCFAVMSFGAWVLVVHDATPKARRAGWIYIVLVVIGEALLVAGMLLAAAQAGTAFDGLAARLKDASHLDLVVGLLLAGFGIKAGVAPLHVWLPLAHPVAPTPASAVLSGAMIKAGLLGWLRFLPLGEASLPGWGEICVVAGMLSAFYGVAVGVTQRNAKTVLAYSSVSQIGLMTVGVGIGLAEPAVSAVVVGAVVIYALHHGLAKGALFLGVGISDRGPQRTAYRATVAAGLLLPAFALAGAPLTSGMPAKALLKEAVYFSAEPWAALLLTLLPIAAAGTMLLMIRFLTLAWPRTRGDEPVPVGLLLPWGLLLLGVALLAWIEFAAEPAQERTPVIPVADIWSYTWPLGIGAALAFLAGKVAWWRGHEVPAGDILAPLERMVNRLNQAWVRLAEAALPPVEQPEETENNRAGMAARVMRWEAWIGRWQVAASAFLALLILLAVTLLVASRGP